MYDKTMGNLKNRIDIRLIRNKQQKILSKIDIKKSFMSKIILENDLDTMRKSKVTVKCSKSAFMGVYILDLSKLLTYRSIMITLKINMIKNQDCRSLILIVWCMKIKSKMFTKFVAKIKKGLVVLQLSQNIMITQTNWGDER